MTPRPDVLVAGEALVDVVHRRDGTVDRRPGGSPATVALALGRLGHRPRLLTALGDDDDGRAVRRWLGASGVVVQGPSAARTSTAIARLDTAGAAEYDFSIAWDITADGVAAAEVLHLGSLAAVLDPGAVAASALLDRHRGSALVCFDPNIRPSLLGDGASGRVLSFLHRADVVKASDEDVAWLAPGEAVEDVARRWARSGPSLVVVTLGAAGALAVVDDAVVRIAAAPVDIVDTVGAGDTFMGALIDGLIRLGATGASAESVLASLGEREVSQLLGRSTRAAAVTVGRPGANPPTRDELERAAGRP